MMRSVRRLRVLAFAAGLAGMAAGASAQQAQPNPQAQLAEIQKILAQPVVPSHLQIATDVLKSSGLMTMFDNSMPNIVGALRMNVTRQRPELTKDIEEALKIVEAETGKVKLDGLSGAARFLAVKLTEAELKEVNTFLTSPTGQKYVTVLPAFMDLALPYVEAWSQEASARLTRLFQEEMAKRGHRL